MHLTVYEQSEIFYFAFVFGIAIGVYYDFFRLLRYLNFNSKSAVILQDLVFMSSSAVLCFWFAQVTVNGHLRAFVIAGHLFGVFSYRYSIGMLSGFFFKIIGNILNFMKRILKNITEKLIEIAHKAIGYIIDKYSKVYGYFVKKSSERKKIETN